MDKFVARTLTLQTKFCYTPLSPYRHRIKFLGKRSLLDLNNQQVVAAFKFNLADFKHTQSSFRRRSLTAEEIDAINNGGEEVTYKHIPKIKPAQISEDDF